jgi:hypothetical protein
MEWSEWFIFHFNDLIANGICFDKVKRGAIHTKIQILIKTNNRKRLTYELKKPNLERNLNDAIQSLDSNIIMLNRKKTELISEYEKTNKSKKNKNLSIETNEELWQFILKNQRIAFLLNEITAAEKKKDKYQKDLNNLDARIQIIDHNIGDLEMSVNELDAGHDDTVISTTLTKIYEMQQNTAIKNHEAFTENLANKTVMKRTQKELEELKTSQKQILNDIEEEYEEDKEIDDAPLRNTNYFKKYFNDFQNTTPSSQFGISSSSSSSSSNSIFSEYLNE